MAVVEANGIAKSYGNLLAVDDLTVSVEAGEIVGMLGPNGAGKTTAVRMLTTILAPSRGSFRVAGIPHTRPEEIRRRIGVLPESAGYPGGQTGVEYLTYHARLYGHPAASARAVARSLLDEARPGGARALADLGVQPRDAAAAGHRACARQRAGRSLPGRADARPRSGRAAAGLGHVRAIARERGAAVILSTHLLNEVEENCSAVLILNRGRVIARGTVADVVRRAAAPGRVRLRVAPRESRARAAVIAGVAAVGQISEPAEGGVGWLTVELEGPGERNGGADPNEVIRALLDAGIAPCSFEVDGARLSDAFLAMTETS